MAKAKKTARTRTVKKKWLPTNFGSMEDRFIVNYFKEEFTGFKVVPPLAMFTINDYGTLHVSLPSAKYLNVQKQKRSPEYGKRVKNPRILYFDKVRQERIFNKVMKAHGLYLKLKEFRYRLAYDKKLFKIFNSWSEQFRVSVIDLESQIKENPELTPVDRVQNKLKCEKIQRQMNKKE